MKQKEIEEVENNNGKANYKRFENTLNFNAQ